MHFLAARPSIRLKHAVLVSAALALLPAACSTTGSWLDPSSTGAITQAQMTPDQQVKYWGDRYAKNEKNRDIAIGYAAALRLTGANDQALSVLQKAVIYFPTDRLVLAAYGKALASAGQLQQALDAVQRAQTPDHPDWKLMSTEASIRDQLGDTANSRKLHAQAAAAMPNDPTILSNYGMSYVLTGDLSQAEALLRKAVALPGADARIRQNLALVVGLEGRFPEAAQIASADLPPDQAAANVDYLKKMLAQQNTWQTLQTGGKTPAAPVAPSKAAAAPATVPPKTG